MPKKEITDYVIYKIICNDENIKDCYVGSTSNFKVRKNRHKNDCNGNCVKYKVYETIRENGGWTNWTMVPIAEHKELTIIQARIKEEEQRVLLNANLNSLVAYRSVEKIKELEKIKNKNYYKANKEQLLEQKKQWREAHPEKIKEYNTTKRQSEERIAYMKEYNKQYREKLKNLNQENNNS